MQRILMTGTVALMLAGCTRPTSQAVWPAGETAAPAVPSAPRFPPAADGLFHWRPLRLGAGGFITGFITHSRDAGVRYCRTDVGNAYRWAGDEWVPMVVRAGARGMPAALAAVPTGMGVDALAVDPVDTHVVYLAMAGKRSPDVAPAYLSIPGSVYKSIDGGVSFTGSDLAVRMDANGAWRTEGERLQVDPRNSAVLYYGSMYEGLWRSLDGGVHWAGVRGNGAPGVSNNVLKVVYSPASGTTTVSGQRVSRVLYAIGGKDAVYGSADGGSTWRDLSAGQGLAGKTKHAEITADGTLYVAAAQSREIWCYRQGQWNKLHSAALSFDLNSFAIDPANPALIYAIGQDGGTSRSRDGGATWQPLGPMRFANTFGWLPQPEGWRSNAGIQLDRDGTLWVAQGNEGMLRWQPAGPADTNRPCWTIDSRGIEELVTHDVIMPPGGRIVVAVEDATGMVTDDPDRFVARQIALQDQLISNGTGLSYCPNAPEFLAVVTADVNHTHSGRTYSGYSVNGGRTWAPFAAYPADTDGKPINPAGSIAISRRGNWGVGSDHLVWLPTGKGPTYYSHDGGRSWHPSAGFPTGNGYWIFALKQRLLAADPFTPDTFYFQGSWRGGFYVSTDGGASWQLQEQAGLPVNTHNAQLAVNCAVPGDLWFVDGSQGASQHGLWHSTTGGRMFTRIDALEFAITLCLGAGRGGAGDAPACVYVYGKLRTAPDWGVFRSADAGVTWDRVSFYPAGIFDEPTCMAASWDRYGVVVVGFTGNSYVIGRAAVTSAWPQHH